MTGKKAFFFLLLFYMFFTHDRGFAQDAREIIKKMEHDKKNTESTLRLILLRSWGEPYITDFEDVDLLHKAWIFALENVDHSQV